MCKSSKSLLYRYNHFSTIGLLILNLSPYRHGKYIAYKGNSYHQSIDKWIKETNFLKYELSNLIIQKKSRKRNKLYCFPLDSISKNVTMKVSETSKDYKFWRRVNVFITSLYKDYNLNSYKNSINLHEAGVDTIVPVAYWTYQFSTFKYKSYFLYENVDSELTVTELYDHIKSSNPPNKDAFIDIISDKHIAIIKSIHSANIRHDDPHGGNILTDIKANDLSDISVSNISNAKFTLIDNDRCKKTHLTLKALKLFFDIKCLTKFNLKEIPHSTLLSKYLGENFNSIWLKVFIFWKSGGFNIKKRIYYALNVKHLYQ